MPTRHDTITRAKQLLTAYPLYLDTETTGLDSWSEIIEIAIVETDGKVAFQSLVKPVNPIPTSATRIHGIDDILVADAPRWNQIWPEVQQLLSGRQVGIYNADFDLRMLQQSNAKYQLPFKLSEGTKFFCIMNLYKDYYGSYRFQSLDSARAFFNIPIRNSHRAVEDTQLARAVLERIAAD